MLWRDMKKIISLTIGLAFVFMLQYVSFAEEAKPLRVVVTGFPLYDFSRQIGGDAVEVTLLLPPGVEAHSFEPKPGDIVKISDADVFIFTNEYMEPWAREIITGAAKPGLCVVDASAGIMLLRNEGNDGDIHETGHRHGDKDPHVWLDLENARTMVMTIAESFAGQDAARAAQYRMNAEGYGKKLADLDARFVAMLAQCPSKTIIYGGHSAFGYFAKRYGLTFISPYAGFSPDVEPTPRAVASLIDTMKRDGCIAVFHEELIDPKVARTIADETGAQLLLLNGAHNVGKADIASGATFLGIMEQNFENVKRGLGSSVSRELVE